MINSHHDARSRRRTVGAALIRKQFEIVVASVEANLTFDDQVSDLIQRGVRLRSEISHELDRFGDRAPGLNGDHA